jgi:hypothetical protein
VRVADFNGDTHPDIVTANETFREVSTVSVLLGNGDGTFQPQLRFKAAYPARALAVGDFNHDDRPDVAVANFAIEGKLSIYRGIGDGTFEPGVIYDAGLYPRAVEVGDFDGNGDPDIVVAGGMARATVFRGNGDGQFRRSSINEVTRVPNSAAVADFDHDGDDDIATAGQSSWIAVLSSNGDATFPTGTEYVAGPQPAELAAGDFNRDGNLDIAVANHMSFGAGNSVSILLGNGDGSLGPPTAYYGFVQPSWMALADFNRDRNLDIVVANAAAPYVTVLLGNGDGTFQSALNSPSGDYKHYLAVGDFDEDGLPDVAVTNLNPDPKPSTLTILIGRGDGTFEAPAEYLLGGIPNGDLVTADFNGDGHLDLAVGRPGRVFGPSSRISLRLGNGDGSFQDPIDYSVPRYIVSLAAGDFNADGYADLVVASHSGYPDYLSTLTLFLGSDAIFRPSKVLGTGPLYVGDIEPGEFNNDNRTDILLSGGARNVLLNRGGDRFGPVDAYAPGGADVVIADLNGDRYVDLTFLSGGGMLPNGQHTGSVTVLINAADWDRSETERMKPSGFGPISYRQKQLGQPAVSRVPNLYVWPSRNRNEAERITDPGSTTRSKPEVSASVRTRRFSRVSPGQVPWLIPANIGSDLP